MTIVTILRELWRQRLIVSLMALLSVVVGMAVAYKVSFPPKLESRQYQIGLATARILLDTPSSQIVEISPKGSESLGERANLLTNLMIDGELKNAIAKRAGLRPDALLVVASDAIEPATASPKALRSRKARILTTKVLTNDAGVQLPIIDLEAQAPDVGGAATLANATVAGLRDYLDSKAAVEKVPDARRLRVGGLGAARTREVSRGPSHVIAIAVVIVLFGMLCSALIAFNALARNWRAAAAAEDTAGPYEPADALFDYAERPPVLRPVQREPEPSWEESPEVPRRAASASPPAVSPPRPIRLDPPSG